MASRCLSSSKKCVIALLLWQSYFAVSGEIIVSPKDTEASIGETIELVCTSTVDAIEWHHLRVGADLPEIVYKDGYIFNGYKGRFDAKNCGSAGGGCRLLIQNVTLNDAGKYICLENSEESVQKPAQLVVYEQYPSTQFCVTRITCSPECNTLDLSCNMKYSGNVDAFMEWRDSAGELVPSTTITINGITTSTVRLIRDHSQSATYTCQVKYPTTSLGSRYNWTLKPQDLLALNSTQEERNQKVTALKATLVIVTVFFLALGIGVLGLIFRKHKRTTTRHHVFNEIIEYDQKQSADKVQQLTEQQTPLVKKESESWTEGEIVPRKKANKNKAIHGLSVIDNELFFITEDDCVVEVFDLITFALLRAFSVVGLVNPNDMVSCPRRKRIYICDWKKSAEDNEIFCVDKDGTLDTKWISENERGRLSITEECQVIVAEGRYNTIREYSPNGQLIKKFQTERNKLHLWHAIKLGNGNFVTSFGDSIDEEVCIIDNQGKTIHSFSNTSDIPKCQFMAFPRTLAVDDDGTIYVADPYHSRIIIFTSQLQWKEELDVTKTNMKLRGPFRVYLQESKSKRQLLVADNKRENKKWIDGKILIGYLT